MLKTRILVVLVLLPVGIAAVLLGGIAFFVLVALILGAAAWEYANLFQTGGLNPARVLVLAGVLLLVTVRYLAGFEHTHWILSLLVLTALTYHLVAYELGIDQAGTDFGVTLGGMLYLGWIGAYLVSLRMLPEGQWWLLGVLVSIWAADTGAYTVGSRFGRRKLSPRLSPRKTWEGYLGGVAAGTLFGALFALAWQVYAPEVAPLTLLQGALLGLIVSALSVLGDLGESLFKRQFGVKDSSHLLPGHGGMFDRIDSWLWGGVIGYYIALVVLRML